MAIPLSLKVRPSVRPCCSSHVHALSASIGVPFYTLLHATMSSVKY
jgi:hypothetical protein